MAAFEYRCGRDSSIANQIGGYYLVGSFAVIKHSILGEDNG